MSEMVRACKRRLWTRRFGAVVLAVAVCAAGLAALSSGAAGRARAGSGCPHPSVRVPPNEPVYRVGPTELVSGLYVQGGAVPPPPCKAKPRGPYAGTITVSNASTGATVASKTVRDGHLAHIPLAPGRYKVSGQFSGGGTSTYSPTVTVRQGYKVRQDVFEDVP
jgi:hypothetical protein